MGQPDLTHWLVTTIVPIVVPIIGVYFVSKQAISKLENRLTRLEATNDSQNKIIDEHSKRISQLSDEQKSIAAILVEIKNLNSGMSEIKADLKEIQKGIKQ